MLLSLIFKCTGYKDSTIRLVAVQCLLEIVRHFYDLIEDQMESILQLTKLHVRHINPIKLL